MDVNTLRIAATLASFAAFIAIFWWAWSGRRAADFEQAAQLPFEQD